MRTYALTLLLSTASASLAAQAPPDSLLDRALAGGGGVTALTAARAFTWNGDATVHLPGRDIRLRGTWRILPPDSAIVATYEVDKGPPSTRRLVLTGTRGWLMRDTTLSPMPPAVLAEERHQFYLYSLLRVVPLGDPGVRLTRVPNDSAGHPGLRIEAPGRLPVEMYFAADGRVLRLHTAFATAGGTPGDAQDLGFSATVEAGGVRWFGRMEIRRAGQPYFDLTITALTVAPALADPLLAGPAGTPVE